MDPTTTATDPISRPKPNGILTRKQQPQHPITRHPQPHPSPPPSLYRECLKNHAASLGGHALDGCGEFMPSPSSNPSDPSSLTCAACGCHRNFHRRTRILLYDYDMEDSGGGGGGGDSSQNDDDTDDGGGGEVDRRHRSTSPSPPSAPHMLLALSTGTGLSPAAAAGPAAGVTLTPTAPTTTPTVGVGVGVGVEGILSRKRFRSKFSPEQKERMQELSERLGWRMQKRDEGILEETCREIGVGKGVFKVWMHNNKHNFVLKNTTTNNNNNNASSSSVNVSASAAGELGLGGEGLVHHPHHNNGVNGSADSSF